MLESRDHVDIAGDGRIDRLQDSTWDEQLARFPGATFFHTTAWARVLRETYGFTPVYFAVGPPERPSALLPVMEVNSWLTGRRGVSLPFTDECDPLSSDTDACRDLLQRVLTYGRTRAWTYWECRGGRSGFDQAPASTIFYGHLLDLQGGEAALFARVDASVRRAVRKAEKSRLTIEFSRNLDSVRAFHGLLGRTRRRHGVPLQPFSFFQNILRHVLEPGFGVVVLARYDRVPIAGAIFFNLGRKVLYKFGASDERHQQLRANNLVMWEAIKYHASLGFATLDFGRTSLGNEGLRRFKLGWGTSERRIEYVRTDLRRGTYVTAADSSLGWHARFFAQMPIFLSRLIGALLYKHIG